MKGGRQLKGRSWLRGSAGYRFKFLALAGRRGVTEVKVVVVPAKRGGVMDAGAGRTLRCYFQFTQHIIQTLDVKDTGQRDVLQAPTSYFVGGGVGMLVRR